jgi:hypothetical protein
MRWIIFEWKHFPGDMVVEPRWPVPIVSNFSTYCNLNVEDNTIAQDERGGIVSHKYTTLFETEADVEKIKFIDVIYNEAETKRRAELLNACFGDILPVKTKKIGTIWFAPWDVISMWYNPMDLLMDLALKPELMHAIMERYTQVMLNQLEQLEAKNMLDVCNNHITGSGGYAYTNDLPNENSAGNKIYLSNQWGNATAQIFSEVSPDMHEEFALQYERRWLNKFGLTYYGCCEPLHNKMEILKSVKSLRKISCSPWCNLEKMVNAIDGKYVMSIKPNPADVATPDMNYKHIRAEFRRIFDTIGDHPCELIFKDISTCQNDVARITDWVNIAQEEIER